MRGPEEKRIPGLREEGCGSPFLSLLWIQLKAGLGARALGSSLGLGDKRGKYAGVIIVLLAIAFIPWMAAMYRLGEAVSEVAVFLNQPGLPVVMGVTAAHFLVFFMTVTHLISTLFYSRDIDTLKAMPLKPHHIVLGKMAVVYCVELLVSAVAAGPFSVSLGAQLGDVLYWPFMVLVHLFLPALPMAVALVGVLALMRFTRFSARRDVVRVVLALIFFAVVVTLQVVSTRVGVGAEIGGYEELFRLISERQGLIRAMTRYYPPARWASFALTAEGTGGRVANLLLLAVLSAGALVLTARVTESWFILEERREAKAPKAGWNEKVERVIRKVHSPLRAVALRDIRILVRTPNFFLTALMNLLVLPLMLLIFSFTSRPGFETMSFSLEDLVRGPLGDLLALAVVGVHGLVVGLNQIPSASVSREGRMFWVSKVIPVPPGVQIRAKMVFSIAYGSLQALIAVGMAKALLGLSWLVTLRTMVLSLAILWPLSGIGLLVDLLGPKLNWTEPQQAMKGNFGTLLAGLLCAGFVVGLGFAVKRLYDAGVTPSALSLALFWVFVITGAGLEGWIERWGAGRYEELEL